MHRQRFWPGNLLGISLIVVLLGGQSSAPAQPADESRAVTRISLNDFVDRVLYFNETLQMRMLALEITRRETRAAQGVFEPELVLGYDHINTRRENSAQQQSGLDVNVFLEENNLYSSGLEALVPSGARVRIGYSLSDLENNLGFINILGNSFRGAITNQYQAFLGFNVTQPVLKNFGFVATMSETRLAALASEIAFHEYRKQLLLTVSAAEAAYWNLYMAQEQMLFFRDSVRLAETIRDDSQTRVKAGKGTELDVLEAESGLGLRKARQLTAWQNYYESINRMTTLYSMSVISSNSLLVAVDSPDSTIAPPSYFESYTSAFEHNPDYQIQRQTLLQEHVRLAYAKNQRLPQLDLKASYGLNGLGDTPGSTWTDMENQDFPSWSVGVEFRIPITGGIQGRNRLSAAKLRQKSALLGLKEIETQIANALDTGYRKARNARASIENYEATVRFNQDLLKTELARLEVGRVESRKVLEVEEDLFEARNAVLEAEVTYQRALLELELIEGSILQNRKLEISRRDLQRSTAELARRGNISEEQYHQVLHDIRLKYRRKIPATDDATLERARQVLDETGTPPEPMSQDDYDEALRLLHNAAPTPPPAEAPQPNSP